MTTARLEERLAWLRRNRFTVLELGEAIERLRSGRIGEREIVITIDDGFYSVYALAAPMLLAYGMPATVYVTTYYVTHQNPIFRLALQYIAWRSSETVVDLAGLLPGLSAKLELHGEGANARLEELYTRCEVECSEEDRTALAREFGRRARVDYDEVACSRRLSLMSPEEIGSLAAQGFNIQLHTHRHQLPLTTEGISREIEQNRTVLASLTDKPLVHFCYPSGIWDTAQWPALSAAGITTATTCLPGFNRKTEPMLGLRRFLDSDRIALHEFAAEMLAIKEMLLRRGASSVASH